MPRPNLLSLLKIGKEWLWRLFDAFNNDELYIINIAHVFQKYMEYNIDDLEEFSVIYTYEYHDRHNKLDDMTSKEKMYTEVLKIMKDLKKKEGLDGQ